MSKQIIQVNEKIGIWTMTEYHGLFKDNKGTNHSEGTFVCECGFIKRARLARIKCRKNEKCYGFDRHLTTDERTRVRSPEQSKLDNARKVFAKYKNRYENFSLSLDDMINIMTSNCYYCNKPPSNKIHYKNKKERLANENLSGEFEYNGLSRIIMAEGFKINNVRPCCFECNASKLDMDEKDFIQWINKAYLKMFSVS